MNVKSMSLEVLLAFQGHLIDLAAKKFSFLDMFQVLPFDMFAGISRGNHKMSVSARPSATACCLGK
jgi:hypothetical protein